MVAGGQVDVHVEYYSLAHSLTRLLQWHCTTHVRVIQLYTSNEEKVKETGSAVSE